MSEDYARRVELERECDALRAELAARGPSKAKELKEISDELTTAIRKERWDIVIHVRDCIDAKLKGKTVTDNPREILSDSLIKQNARLRSDLEAERAWKRAHVIIAEQLIDITKELNELKLKYYDAERRLKLKDELIRKLTSEATQ
jgi:hypothetical protein